MVRGRALERKLWEEKDESPLRGEEKRRLKGESISSPPTPPGFVISFFLAGTMAPEGLLGA